MDIWLHIGLPDREPGYHAWGLRQIGFATWAPAEERVISLIPAKFDGYQAWLGSHRLTAPSEQDETIRVVERVEGDEILFEHDREGASVEEIDRTVELLAASRSDLFGILEIVPEEALSREPPYARFAEWADWRTIPAILAHLANSETHYYMAMIGHESTSRPVDPNESWREFLPTTRAESLQFLEGLKADPDRSRVRTIHRRGRRAPQGITEEWSVRKVLRRMVRHELMHTKSIRRILTEWEQQKG